MNPSQKKTRLPGGVWDKLGNRYESLWTVDALLSVLRGEAVSVTVEPHGEDGQGVEFFQELNDGTRQYVSAKRQNAVNVWSLAELTRPKQTGRSILGDLFDRLADSSSRNRATFVSQTTPNKLLRVCEEAQRADSAKRFEEIIRASNDLGNEVEDYLVRGLKLEWQPLWNRLRRLTVRGADEKTMREWLERIIGRDIVRTDNQRLSPASARLLLYELVYSSFQKPIVRQDIVAHLAAESLALRDWNRPTADHDALDRRNRLYALEVEAELIQNRVIPRKEVSELLEEIATGSKTVVLAGSAGLGKSCVLAQCLRALEENPAQFR